ncbi:hypothetical protein E3T39_13525 [Cryobacterium suzukii]|uniref:Uncharacterized protein n=1 Tax=Cryobacterium suzukii TaxID=1259198 RepID=A0A4R9ADB2_9MICO|nr:hypothetical protein [Cryobacterium suzukii]TFD57792.1 hypothetical protein E3T39_13525 [Cryobacterium suzukii]
MPWWSWLLIWGVLVAGLFTVLGWYAMTLYRKAVTTLRALELLSDQVSAVDLVAPSVSVSFVPAVFADAAVVLRNVEQNRADRSHRNQVRRDARIVRGKLMRNAR